MNGSLASPITSGLVVDSSLVSRRQLVYDLREHGLVGDVVEAQSVNNGLDTLISKPLDLCIMGPSLSELSSVDFVTRGKLVAPKSCAFVAVVRKNRVPSQSLCEAGADALIEYPYTKQTLTSVVTETIQTVRALCPAGSQPNEADLQALLLSQAIETLPVSLIRTARRIKIIAADITQDKLSLAANGDPSPTIKTALEHALESALCIDTEEAKTVGSFEHNFVKALVEWFTDRVHYSERVCNEKLRRRLLGFG